MARDESEEARIAEQLRVQAAKHSEEPITQGAESTDSFTILAWGPDSPLTGGADPLNLWDADFSSAWNQHGFFQKTHRVDQILSEISRRIFPSHREPITIAHTGASMLDHIFQEAMSRMMGRRRNLLFRHVSRSITPAAAHEPDILIVTSGTASWTEAEERSNNEREEERVINALLDEAISKIRALNSRLHQSQEKIKERVAELAIEGSLLEIKSANACLEKTEKSLREFSEDLVRRQGKIE